MPRPNSASKFGPSGQLSQGSLPTRSVTIHVQIRYHLEGTSSNDRFSSLKRFLRTTPPPQIVNTCRLGTLRISISGSSYLRYRVTVRTSNGHEPTSNKPEVIQHMSKIMVREHRSQIICQNKACLLSLFALIHEFQI